jgi:hypothetical protein
MWRSGPWTEEDIAKLTYMAQRFPVAEIAENLGRTVGATQVKAHTLKISLRLNPYQAGSDSAPNSAARPPRASILFA